VLVGRLGLFLVRPPLPIGGRVTRREGVLGRVVDKFVLRGRSLGDRRLDTAVLVIVPAFGGPILFLACAALFAVAAIRGPSLADIGSLLPASASTKRLPASGLIPTHRPFDTNVAGYAPCAAMMMKDRSIWWQCREGGTHDRCTGSDSVSECICWHHVLQQRHVEHATELLTQIERKIAWTDGPLAFEPVVTRNHPPDAMHAGSDGGR
jgi:hypothetical protein